MSQIAGIPLGEERFQELVLTVAMPDLAITDVTTGATVTPADDLPGYIATSIGLDPATLSTAQQADIDTFISTYTL